MSFEPRDVEKLFEIIEVEVNLREVFLPTSINEAKRAGKRVPENILTMSKASDAIYSGKEAIEIVEAIDEEIGRLLSVKGKVMDAFQKSIVDNEEKNSLENLA